MIFSKKILLIVDNDEDWLELLERFLKGQGFEVLSAQNNTAAVKTAMQTLPDCAIVDMKLGAEDGMDLCRFIKASPVLKGVPVIMLSGLDGAPEDAGCDAFVCKADGMDRLLSVIKKLIAEK